MKMGDDSHPVPEVKIKTSVDHGSPFSQTSLCKKQHEGTTLRPGVDDDDYGEETLSLRKIKWKFLKNELKGRSDCQLDYKKDEQVLYISGKGVGEKKSDIITLLQKAKVISMKLSSSGEKNLKTGNTKELLNEFCKDECDNSVYSLEESTLTICGSGDIEEKFKKIKDKFLATCTLEIPPGVPKNKIREIVNSAMKCHFVTADFDDEESSLDLIGMNENVTHAVMDIKQILGDNVWEFDTFTLKGKEAAYVKRHAMKQLKKYLEAASITEENVGGNKISLAYKYQKSHEKKLKEGLLGFREDIIKTKVNLKEFDAEEIKLIEINLKQDKSRLKQFESTHTCCIFVEPHEDNETDTNAPIDSSDFNQQVDDNFSYGAPNMKSVASFVMKTFYLTASNKHVQRAIQMIQKYANDGDDTTGNSGIQPANINPSNSSNINQQIGVFTLGTSCTVQILPSGNITREKSDLLVCGLHESLDMKRTSVSASFQRNDSSLQHQIKSSTFSKNGVFISTGSSRGTNGQPIAFVVLKRWRPGVSDQRMTAAITEVLDEANKMGITSLSFPPMGIGRALKFPNDRAAQSIVGAINSFVIANTGGSNSIKAINLIASDQQYFTEMIKAMNSVGSVKIGGGFVGTSPEVNFGYGAPNLKSIACFITTISHLIASNQQFQKIVQNIQEYTNDGDDTAQVNDSPDDSSNFNQHIECFTLGTSCAIQILPSGNITREKSDLLVCGLHKSLDMKKSRVSSSFHTSDGSLQHQIKSSTFSHHGVFISTSSSRGTIGQTIAFVILKAWQSLTAAITEVLDEANRMGITSVSFPPLGIGKTFKFPDDRTAQAIVSAISSFVISNSGGSNNIKTINVIAPGQQYFTEMVKAMNSVVNVKRVATVRSDREYGKGKAASKVNVGYGASSMRPIKGFMSRMFNVIVPNEQETIQTLKHANRPLITIVSEKQEDMASKFKEEMKRYWLSVDYFKPIDLKLLSPQFMNDVTKTANALHVRIQKLQDSTTNRPVCKIKGREEDVRQMKDSLYEKVMEIKDQSVFLFSPHAPRRGTVKFVKYAISCDPQFPSYWNLTFKDFSEGGISQQATRLHNVDKRVYKAVESLVLKTWDANNVGMGHDALNIPSDSQLKVLSVQRIENPTLFLKYFAKRSSILRDMELRGRLCKDIGQLCNSKGQAQTMQHLDAAMKTELLPEVNEQYFFHGTKDKLVKILTRDGLDNRVTSSSSMFGQGVYTAESSTKADQYADDRHNRLPKGSDLFMFLTRVVLGEVFLCDDKHETVQTRGSPKLKRPPCLSCLQDVCDASCHAPGRSFHSVVGDGKKWLFREFVAYSNDQCYPEYLIKYQRV